MIITNEELEILRKRREKECFTIINRGVLWYDRLSKEQINELDEWYEKWLNVTHTGAVPSRPLWIDSKLRKEKEEILL